MIAIILAAGSHTQFKIKIPKCLHDLGGETILDRQIRLLDKRGIDDITVVVSFRKWKIIWETMRKHPNLKYIFSMDERKNCYPLYSLMRTQHLWKDDVIVIEGDVVFTEDALTEMLERPLHSVGFSFFGSEQKGVEVFVMRMSRKGINYLKSLEDPFLILRRDAKWTTPQSQYFKTGSMNHLMWHFQVHHKIGRIVISNFMLDVDGKKDLERWKNLDRWKNLTSKTKVIILAAGPTLSTKRPAFPENSKPKCLFHVQGETVLEKQIRILKKVGIGKNDIVVVGGYKIEMIERFNKNKNLGLKIVYNPTAISDHWVNRGWAKGLDTVKVGLRELSGDDNDDVLLIFGDALLTEGGMGEVIDHPKRCISVYSHHGYQLYKIPRELLPKLRNLKPKKFPESEGKEDGAMHALHEFCMENNGIRLWIRGSTLIYDVDQYAQTDEGKKAKAEGEIK